MYFVKLKNKYINLDNVTTIELHSDGEFVVHFVGQTHNRSIGEDDLRELYLQVLKEKEGLRGKDVVRSLLNMKEQDDGN